MKKYILFLSLLISLPIAYGVSEWPIAGGTGEIGAVTGPGIVPIGGMFSMLKIGATGSEQWQPPATGVIKDGFMIADGNGNIPGSGPLAGLPVPNMSGANVRGVSTLAAATGTTGSNQHTMATSDLVSHAHTGSNGSTGLDSLGVVTVTHSVSGTMASQSHKHQTGIGYSGSYLGEYCAYGLQGSTPTTTIFGPAAGTGTVNICLSNTPNIAGTAVSVGSPSISAANFNHTHGGSTPTINATATATTNIPTVPVSNNILWLVRVE